MNKSSRKYRKLMEIRSKNSIRRAFHGRMPNNFNITTLEKTISMKEFIENWLLMK